MNVKYYKFGGQQRIAETVDSRAFSPGLAHPYLLFQDTINSGGELEQTNFSFFLVTFRLLLADAQLPSIFRGQ